MNKARRSLTRKLGPLPVWAWAVITGAAIFGYRYMKGQYGPSGGGNTANTVTGEVQPVTDPQDVTTLSPGESAYDPNTGALISTAPDQQPAADAPPGSDPITLAPGESVYDPGTGKLLTPGKPTTPPHKKPHKKPPTKTRKKHTKPAQHSGKNKVARQPHHSAGKKPHGKGGVSAKQLVGRVRHATPAPGKSRAHPRRATPPSAKPHPAAHHTAATEPKLAAHPPIKPAAHRAPHPTVNRPGRVRATPPRTGAMRQRPAATHPAPRGRHRAR